MPTVRISIQCDIVVYGKFTQARKTNVSIGKKETKLSLFADALTTSTRKAKSI